MMTPWKLYHPRSRLDLLKFKMYSLFFRTFFNRTVQVSPITLSSCQIVSKISGNLMRFSLADRGIPRKRETGSNCAGATRTSRLKPGSPATPLSLSPFIAETGSNCRHHRRRRRPHPRLSFGVRLEGEHYDRRLASMNEWPIYTTRRATPLRVFGAGKARPIQPEMTIRSCLCRND